MALSSEYLKIKEQVHKQSGKAEEEKETPKLSQRYLDIKKRVQHGAMSTDVDEQYVQDFFRDAYAWGEDTQNRLKNMDYASATNKGAKQARADAASDIFDRSGRVRTYLNLNRNRMPADTYSGMMAALDGISDYHSRSSSAFQDMESLIGQFETEEDYLKAGRYDEYRRKYAGKSYSELKNKLSGLDPKSEEYAWLSAYLPSAMTQLDYTNEVLSLNRDLSSVLLAKDDVAYYENLMNQGKTKIGDAAYENYLGITRGIYQQFGGDLDAYEENVRAKLYRAENAEKYFGLPKKADYAAKSVYSGGGSGLQKLINDQHTAKVVDTAHTVGQYAPIDPVVNTYAQLQQIWNYENTHLMTEDEVKNFNYLYNTEGEKAAKEYLDYLQYALNERSQVENMTKISAILDEAPVWAQGLASFASTPIALSGGAGILDVAAQNAIKGISGSNKPIDYNRDSMIATNASATIRGTVAQNIADSTGVINLDEQEHPVLSKMFNGKNLGDVYQLGMSMQDSAAVAALSTINPVLGKVGTALLGGSAASQAVLDAVKRGASDEQALTVGVLAGGFEILFEQYELDQVLDVLKTGGKSAVASVVSQVVTEGVGEGATEIANMLADTVVMADKSNWQANVQKYLDDNPGWTREQAEKQAFMDAVVQVGDSVVGGMLSGGIMGGGAHVIHSGVQYVQEQNRLDEEALQWDAESLIDEALALNPDDAYALKLKSKLEAGKELTGSEIRKLMGENESAIKRLDIGAISDAAYKRLAELGEYDNVQAVADALAKQAAGEKLTHQEYEAIRASKYGERVAYELSPENIDSGESASQWARNIGTERINTKQYGEVDAQAQQDGTETAAQATQTITEDTGATNKKSLPESVYTAPGKDENSALIAASKKYGAQAGTMVKYHQQDQDVEKYDQAWQFAYNMGKDGASAEYVRNSEALSYLTEAQRNAAYADGVQAAENMATVNGMIEELGITGSRALTLTQSFNANKITAKNFAMGLQEAYNAGKTGVPMKNAGRYASMLTEAQRSIAYKQGKKAAGAQIAMEEWRIQKNRNTDSVDTSKGKVHFDGDRSKLNDQQKTALDAMEILSKALGLQFYVENWDGTKDADKNGWYNLKDGSIHINLNAGYDGKGTMLFTVAHELTHFIKQWSPAKFRVLANFLVKQYGEQGTSVDNLVRAQQADALEDGRKLSYEEAFEEMVADSMETMLNDGNVLQMMAELRQQDHGLWQKIKSWFKNLAQRLKAIVGAYEGVVPDSTEGRLVADMQDMIVVLESLYADALVEASDNYTTAAQKNTTPESGGVKHQARKNGSMDDAEIQAVQSIGRKSVNAFTTTDMQKTEGLARQYWGEMREKSPFFRAWFGDWRINDQTPVQIADKADSTRGVQKNEDTGWDIQVSGQVFSETKSHNSTAAKEARPYLPYINDIVKKAVLLDTWGFNQNDVKSVNSLLMHSLYAVADIGSGPEVLKLYVEEMNNPSKANTSKRAYQLQNIEKAFIASVRVQGKAPSSLTNTKNAIRTVADLFAAVKQKDSSFNPKPASKIVNGDGTPMVVYHGTSDRFTQFKDTEISPREGSFFFAQNREDAEAYSGNGTIMEVYVNLQNPIDYNNMPSEIYRLKDKKAQVDALKKLGYDGWYCDMDSGWGEVSAFYPEQIKSATDNIGTFDGNNPDIRYSAKKKAKATYAEIEEERQKLFQRERDLLTRKSEAENNPDLLKAMDEYSAIFDEARGLFVKRKNGIATQAELDRIQELKTLREERLKRVADLQESLGLAAMEKEMYDIRAEKETLRIASDEAWAREGAEKENRAIAKAGVPAAEFFRGKALKAFKTTANFNEAGYLLPDGKMLNFSGGERNHRYRDHREIGEIYEATQGAAALNRFLSDGNIRIMAESPGVDLPSGVEPTHEQYAAMRKFINANGVKDSKFFVDFSGEDGRRVGGYAYEGRVNAERVLHDIKYFYENGRVREQSMVAQFHYSEKNADHQKVMQALEKENAKLKEDVAELRELVKLQRQVTGGTRFTKTSVEAAARYLKQTVGAKGDTKALKAILDGFYGYIASGNELTWEGVKEQAQEAVDWLWEHMDRKAKPSEYAQDILNQLHGSRVYLDESQMAEAIHRFGSYNDFRKQMMGSITFAKDADTSLDSLWQEMSTLYPDVFDGEISSADMPGALMDTIQRLRTSDTSALDYARNREMFRQEIFQQVYDSYWRVSTMYTAADVRQRQIDRLKGEHYQRMNDLKQSHRETVSNLKKEHQARLEQVRQDYRAKLEEQTGQITKRYQDARKKNVEGRRKTEMRGKIRKTIRDLNKILSRGTKERNVKEGMRGLVANAIASAEVLFIDTYTEEDMIRNGVGVDLSERESKLLNQCIDILAELDHAPAVVDEEGMSQWQEREQKLKDKLSKLKKELSEVFEREYARLNGVTVKTLLDGLREEYAALKTAEEDYLRDAFDADVQAYLDYHISQGISAARIRDLRLDQLETLHEIYTMVLTTVRNANKSFAENLKQTRKELAQQVMAEVKESGGVHKMRSKGQDRRARRSWNNEKPVFAFERLGSETMKTLYNNLRNGEDVWMVDMDHAREFYLKVAKEAGYNGWDFKKRHTFTNGLGQEFSLDLQQIMSIYAYSRRGQQAVDHLMKGGFVFDKNTEVVLEKGIRRTYALDDATAYNLPMDTIQEIIGTLTKEQSAFVEKMQGYLSDTMGAKGNEVSMKLYGVKLYKESNYFPLRSSGAYMSKAKVQEMQKEQGAVSIKNSGFTHSTTPNASNPVVLSGFMDVWANHVNDMSMYHAFVLPLEDFNKVYHYSTPHTEDGQSASVNEAIINAYGSAATGYIDQLIRDVNGGVVADPRESDYKAWISKFKKASVMMSASVVVQQPSAIVRALAYVDPKYFGVATISRGIVRAAGNKVTNKHTELFDELKKYAPIAAIKKMGYFDTNMGMTAVDYLTVKEFDGFKDGAKGFLKDKQYRQKKMDDWMGFAAALADEISWVQIWQAVKKEVADQQKLKPGTEEHLQAAGKRFTEVVTKTQVYDSVFSRSANMRSKGALMSMTTSFMAEPTTTANMLTDAIRKAKKGDVKFFLRTSASLMGSIIFNNLLRSAVYAMRDDDEDETAIEKYLQAFAGGMMDDLIPLNYMPFWRDVWSVAQGYDVERADMSVVADAIDAAQSLADLLLKDTSGMDDAKLEEHYKKLKDAGWAFTDGIASVLGIPWRNVRRDVNGIRNTIDTVKQDVGGRPTTGGSLRDNVAEDFVENVPGVNIFVDGDSKSDDLYDAIIGGDQAYVERLRKTYKDDAAYLRAKRKGLQENDARIVAAAKARYDGNLEEYMRLAKEIIAEGRFDVNDVVTAVNAEISKLEESGTASATKDKGLFNADAFAIAISQGNSALADEAKADIIQTAQKNGKTLEEAEKSFISSATAACKSRFAEGDLSEEQAVNALVDYCGKSQAEARGSVAYWDYALDNPEADVSAAWFTTYQKKLASSGISVDTYVDYRMKKAGFTKRDDILRVIHSMPLSRKQKDSLYFAEGYAESTLDEAPWH